MKTLVVAIAFGSLMAAPAFAQPYGRYFGTGSSAYGAVTPSGSPTAPKSPQNSPAAAREAALRECSVASRRYLETTWGTMQIYQFRACMTQDGQLE
jgi:hypothetical protein